MTGSYSIEGGWGVLLDRNQLQTIIPRADVDYFLMVFNVSKIDINVVVQGKDWIIPPSGLHKFIIRTGETVALHGIPNAGPNWSAAYMLREHRPGSTHLEE